MSKIANWGRWFIAGCVTADFAMLEWRRAPAAIQSVLSAPMAWDTLGVVGVDLVIILFCVAVVRGLLTWDNATHALLVVFYSLLLIADVLGFLFGNAHNNNLWAVDVAIGCPILIWLLLPSVRGQYRNPEHVS